MSTEAALANSLEDPERQQGRLAHVPLSMIRESTEAEVLRKVDPEDEKFLGLMESIRKNGIMNPISIREVRNPANPDVPMYGLVDGRHRFTAASMIGMLQIPAYIRSVEDGDLLEAQILANVHKIDTKPMEYTNALINILSANPLMTMREMAQRLSKTEEWLSERLKLVNITDPRISEMVNEGSIKLVNAYALAKLPAEKQAEYVDQAIALTHAEFIPKVHKINQELKKAKQEGRAPKTDDYIVAPYLQKVGDIKAEVEQLNIVASLLTKANITDPLLAAQLALKWVLHLDPMSIAQDTEDWKKQRELSKSKAEERKAEREKAKKDEEMKKSQSILSLK